MTTTTTSPKNGTKTILTKDSLVPLGLVGALLAAALWFSSQFQTMQFSLATMKAELSSMKATLSIVSENQWTEDKMKLWIELMKASNQGKDIIVPEIPK